MVSHVGQWSASVKSWSSLPGPIVSTDTIVLIASVYFALFSNRQFWQAALQGRDASDTANWTFTAAALVALVCLHWVLFGLVLNRWTARPLLSALLIATALATYFMSAFGVYLDPAMIRNAAHTEPKEALDLIGLDLFRHLVLEAGPGLALLWWVRIRRRPLRSATLRRIATLGTAAVFLIGTLLFSYQDMSGLFRNQKEIRYLVTPANYLYSIARVALTDRRSTPLERRQVGGDARLAATWDDRTRPVLFVIVVGETARAANWGLNGYRRDTTPALARLSATEAIVNFSQVTACGTDTETSVPCVFSAIGRRDYDETRIRGSDSLLHILARTGFRILWRDNQSGCKGVCAGLPFEQVDIGQADCQPGNCRDDKLLAGLSEKVSQTEAAEPGAASRQIIVLHQLGNHGPAYFKRLAAEQRVFTPTCDTQELRRCTVDAIVNSYDNALRATDRFLADTIGFLKARSATHDVALLYFSDHGESLGENGLFLHGLPYAIAPSVQTRVPMLLWTSAGFRERFSLDGDCLRAKASRPLTHDHVFHSVLGLLQVETSIHDASLDLTQGCRLDRDKR